MHCAKYDEFTIDIFSSVIAISDELHTFVENAKLGRCHLSLDSIICAARRWVTVGVTRR